jgi:carbamoylphosphate synthase large subunit
MSVDTILITCAGSGGANNLMRSIRASSYSDAILVGTDSDRVLLQKSKADHNYAVPRGDDPAYVDAINAICSRHEVDIFVPQHETEVRNVASQREDIEATVLLPSETTVRLCLDKYNLQERLAEKGFPVPETASLAETSIDEAFNRMSKGEPLWCRSRYGSSSMEARPVRTPTQAREWIKYWVERGGRSFEEFTLAEFLPGKDYQVFTLWNDGDLVLGKACDRQRYFFGQEYTGASTPLVSQLIDRPDLHETAQAVIEEVAPNATGNLGIDFKMSTDGVPKITEINVGKFVMVNDFFNLTGEHNMAELFLDIAKGADPHPEPTWGDVDTDMFLIRGIDLEPDIVHRDDIEATRELS